MCGRFTLRTPSGLLVEQFMLDSDPELLPRFNIAPTQDVAVVRAPKPGQQRQLEFFRWGLIPSWAKDTKIGNRMINARAETVAEKPAFRKAFQKRRCLIPSDGYYEWKAAGKRKQPFHICRQDERPFAFAGLWECWHDEQDRPLWSCTIITTDANELTRPIHDRMPVIIDRADYQRWLHAADEDEIAELKELLKPYQAAPMKAEAVSTHVNNPRHEDPSCLDATESLFE